MPRVAECMTWAASAVDLKAYLGVVGAAEDLWLELWLAAAVDACDRFLGNPFDGSDTELAPLTVAGDPSTVPAVVRLGVYEYVKAARAQLAPGASSAPAGQVLASVKTGDLAESYAVASSPSGGGAVGADLVDPNRPPDAIFHAVKGWWRSYRYKFTRP